MGGRRARELVLGAVGLLALVALMSCAEELPQTEAAVVDIASAADPNTAPTAEILEPSSAPIDSVSTGSTSTADNDGEIDADNDENQDDLVLEIDLDGPTAVFDRRLLGTNLPAWLGPDRLLDPAFQANALASGTTLVRMPGGTWSNAYDWSACEQAVVDRCVWTWAAKPSHFARFMSDTGLAGMWTLSINHTAQNAAAAVAFFNGEVGDTTLIGLDRNGVDWGTVDRWARLRAAGGNPTPVRIDLWEIGNKVYGGTPESGGSQCKSFGWEMVWTCDGTEYVNGVEGHDGYLEIRAAMLAVDPTIQIGAVGVPNPGDWNDWGNEVIEAAGQEMDFYIVHQYGFESSPGTVPALRRPTVLWPGVVGRVRAALGTSIPIAITEYNLVAQATNDPKRSMTQTLNGLYIAESIGQMSTLGVSIANQWNLASGTDANGTDYGMINANDGSRFPQFEALATWSRAGTRLLPALNPAQGVKIYPTLHEDGRITLIVVGRASQRTTWTIALGGLASGGMTITTTVAAATEPTADEFEITTSASELGGAEFELDVPAWSISSIDLAPSSQS